MSPFKELGLSLIADDLLKLSESKDGWFKYHEFDTLLVPHDILDKEPFFYGLPPFKAGLLKMAPFTCYDWHVDGRRAGAINMLLKGGGSYCLFKDKDEKSHHFKVTELVYKLDTYYAFDTQTPHMVLNDQYERVLFTVEFETPMSFDYLCEVVSSGG